MRGEAWYHLSHATVILQHFVCEKPLQFCHFVANLSTLRSYLCDRGSVIPILGYISANLGSVNISEVGMHLALLGLLLAGLLLRTLHTPVHFASCHHSDCSVLAAGKSRSNRMFILKQLLL